MPVFYAMLLAWLTGLFQLADLVAIAASSVNPDPGAGRPLPPHTSHTADSSPSHRHARKAG